MRKYSVNETYTAAQNQQVFNIEKPFINDTISVFLNGKLQTFGEDNDYVTSQDTGRIVFRTPLEAGDTVSVISNIVSRKINLEIVSPGRADKPNALYKKYGTVNRLKSNNKYEICICIRKEIFRWNFLSKLSPMFVQSRRIWEDIGEFIEGFTEEYIQSTLYQNSKEVIGLIDELANQEDPVTNATYEVDENGNYTGSISAVKNWVRYKTDIDLIYARYYGISLRYGSVKKSVGDIAIEKSTKLPYLDQLLDKLKKGFNAADEAIRGVDTVAYGVKAINDYKYDDWARVTNF